MSSSITYTIAVLALSIVTWYVRSYLRLRHIPGPFWARFSNLPRFLWVAGGNAHDVHIALHRKYGDLVRIGPNIVSVTDPEEIPKIYDFAGRYLKSDFYRVLTFSAGGKLVRTIFSTQDGNQHRTLRKPIANLYSMSYIASHEKLVDQTMAHFFQRLDELFVQTSHVCDLGTWIQYFAWDVIGNLTFSKPLGFLEAGGDVENITESIGRFFGLNAMITQMPWLDYLFFKNPILHKVKKGKASPVVTFAMARANERLEELENKQGTTIQDRDFLSGFINALSKDPTIPKSALTAWATSNVTAGSDTTSILTRSVIYQLLKHPSKLERLMAELEQAHSEGRLSPYVTWHEAQQLPYLDAVIKEAGRLHPPFGLHLERHVPAEGALICGEHLPAGTIVGINSWAIHRREDPFGLDADDFWPERWLVEDEGQRRKMARALLTFGAGRRVCLGKHISILEIYKLIPSVFWRYKVSLFDVPDFVSTFRPDLRITHIA
ncbi:putative benzoate 4-monooxygenase cytochrome P450 [Aspergillus carlsbadensis]|nr:putative benzoate 4-monooxygenase cytochrome P450 [Aspergillus carlsbadensis]